MSRYKGGYKLVDLNNVNIEPDAVTAAVVPGAYDAIEASHRKRIVVTGLVVDGVEQNDREVDFVSTEAGFVATLVMPEAAYIFTVDDDDKVTLTTPAEPEPEPGT